MSSSLTSTLEAAGIEISTFERAIGWAVEAAERERLNFDHSDCDGGVNDFEACEHTVPEKGEQIQKSFDTFNEYAVCLDSLRKLI